MKVTLIKDATATWAVEVAGAAATYTWGKVDGKKQVQLDVYKEGKQKRDAAGQARFEALSAAKKKVRLGYCYCNEQSDGLTSGEKKELEAAVEAFHVSPAPMLALELDAKRKAKLPPAVRRYVQKKLDGRRCLANLNTGALYSRGRKPMEGLEHIATAVKELRAAFPPEVVWLDGEVYKHGLGFQTVTSLATGTHHTSKGNAAVLQYHVYDLVSPLPFSQRLALLTAAKLPTDEATTTHAIVLVATHATATDAEADTLHAQYVGAGYEGSIWRIDGIGYEEDKRSPSLLKRKDWQQEEFRVVEFLKEEHVDTLGSVLLQDAAGVQFAAAPAMTDDDKLDVWKQRAMYIGYMATVKFFERHESGAPRFPTLLGFRDAGDMSKPKDTGKGKGKDKKRGRVADEDEPEKPTKKRSRKAKEDKDEPVRIADTKAVDEEPVRMHKNSKSKSKAKTKATKVTTHVKEPEPIVDVATEKAKAKKAAEAKATVEAIQAAAPTTLMPVLAKKKVARGGSKA